MRGEVIKTIIDWVRRHKVLTIFIIVAVFLLPLLVIQLLFWLKTPESWITSAEWSAGETIQYCVGFFTLLGTLALGAVAARQSEHANEIAQAAQKSAEQANEINARMVEHETNQKIRSSMPTIFLERIEHNICLLQDLKTDYADKQLYFNGILEKSCYHMCFVITNSTNEIIYYSQPYLTLVDEKGDGSKIVFDTSEFGWNENVALKSGESGQIHFIADEDRAGHLFDYGLRLAINLYNRFGEAYRQNIKGSIIANNVSEKCLVLFNVYSDYERYNYTTNKWNPLDINSLAFQQQEKG